MKKLTLIACAVFLLAACNDSKSGKKPAMKTAKDSFSYAFGAYSGSMLHNFKINEIDWDLFKAALEEGLKNGDSALAIDRETIGKVLQNYTVEAQFGANRVKGAEYIAKQKSNIRLYVINPYQDGLGQGIFFLNWNDQSVGRTLK